MGCCCMKCFWNKPLLTNISMWLSCIIRAWDSNDCCYMMTTYTITIIQLNPQHPLGDNCCRRRDKQTKKKQSKSQSAGKKLCKREFAKSHSAGGGGGGALGEWWMQVAVQRRRQARLELNRLAESVSLNASWHAKRNPVNRDRACTEQGKKCT